MRIRSDIFVVVQNMFTIGDGSVGTTIICKCVTISHKTGHIFGSLEEYRFSKEYLFTIKHKICFINEHI